MDSFNRRNFVKGAAILGASSSVNAFNIQEKLGNDKPLKIALVGCGGRGTGAAMQAMKVRKGVQLVAVADAFQDKAEAIHKRLTRKENPQIDLPKERVFHGFDAYKKAIDSDCDLVILTTPPHFRPIHLEYAISKNKHVFMEKPVAVDGPGIRSVMKSAEVAKSKNLMLACGLQRHHQFDYRESIQRCKDGDIGNFQYAKVYWNSGGVWTRKRQEGMSEMEYQMKNWYYFNWLCGDHIVEQHIHNLDVINWLKGSHPVSCSGMGGRQVRTSKDHGEIFDHFSTEYQYADGTQMFSQARHMKNCTNKVDEYAYGDKGMCHFGAHKITGANNWKFSGKRVSGHQQEWYHLIEALDRGEIYNEGYNGAVATMTAIMGRMANYSGKTVTWEQALNSTEALVPEGYDWAANPPTLPNADMSYQIPTPGQYKVI
ncbi:Gfo/Idh/MocA family oxidoreductase [Lentisphaera profundi]|uniref:Gfo/Idh/MocA family oxidoreductase n=1 Tax=Lentisphaera profundi TaxID=1658616 RepID=A0ABY7VS12_9BACT|nr:Gfo/Idh/MocA family oxidoreductase [Lentisphaera profundi]WDE96008.1 Gfo/Idh/MocA family oxidoreductase [Lentisphaera profundi]